ncbi:unnamed protein product [Owenia fusiformis]|uniref:L-Fucosyltransferase n=1 Tax=Owenia fusiformis TaxID=6347 RepID=A0A8S4PFY0_OWEFU|nr:unnamed protein product [Owenia fusiformis]
MSIAATKHIQAHNMDILVISKIKYCFLMFLFSSTLSYCLFGFWTVNNKNKELKLCRDARHFFIGIQYAGRLGNKMFQYSAAYSIAKANNLSLLITENDELREYFSLSALRSQNNGMPLCSRQVKEEIPSGFSSSVMNITIKKNITLVGYFQSYKYWQDASDEIYEEFSFNEDVDEIASQFIAGVQTDTQINITLVGVHVRRADMSTPGAQADGYTVPRMSYFEKAMEYFRQNYTNVKFIICSDDIGWCEENMNFQDVIISKGHSPIVDLAILSKCNHNIISTGSFGWWGAYLAGGQTVYYGYWPKPGSQLSKTVVKNDYFPPQWIPML